MLDKIVEHNTPPSESERNPELLLADSKLDKLFSSIYDITHTRQILRLNGIDRVWSTKKGGHRLTVDYVHCLGNSQECFIEVHIAADVPGWLFTNLNQVTAIYNSHLSKVAVVDFMKLKREVIALYKNKVYPLKNYRMEGSPRAGVFVPFGVIAEWGKVFEVRND